MIYRISFSSTEGNDGYSFTTSKKEANKLIREYEKANKEFYGEAEIIEEIKKPKNIFDWILLLNRVAGHNDNG